ncbi:hypothetical protein WA026_018766 [Henosepilachna vigintioctopunctata]|uniref:Renin receptor n=1 Tax=Henosepilachna vigintioctopunctata TaxID=420089 RepID=A0AAW1TQM3_9CUCU
MIRLLLSLQLAFFLIEVNASGEFSILHHPKSISFKGHDELGKSTISEVYSAALGFSNNQFSNWNGMFINDPFYLAEAIAAVYIEGVPSIDQPKGHHFPVKADVEEGIFNNIKDNIILRYPQEKPLIVDVDLSNGVKNLPQNSLFKDLLNKQPIKNKLVNLKNDGEEREFLKEVNILNLIADRIADGIVQADGIPDFYWFKVSGLHPLIDYYGDNSTEAKEARKLLNEAILQLSNALKKAYKGAVLVSIITNDASHTRRTRSILADDKSRDLNLASDYSENFPVIFNIILWLSVILGFSLLAISLTIGNMDPGRDSIIYRMTNPRMKKDN